MHILQQLRSGALAGSRSLKISAGLTTFPPEIFSLAGTLEMLDLTGNQLSALPDDFDRLAHLKILFLSDNLFIRFPDVIGRCHQLDIVGFKANRITTVPEGSLPASLRWLILTNNCIEALPASIGQCQRLQKLMLAGNRLQALPPELARCTNLALLRISANRFRDLPGWLLQMQGLAWLAFAGNHITAHREQAAIPEIPWTALKIQEQLGEGASGIINKAQWQQDGKETPVAVKIFKGEVTSDGLPADEMKACMAAGRHPNLVPVSGKIVLHPLMKEGLVLGLIPATFKNLGLPPSFETCTRDTFQPGSVFSTIHILAIAKGIAHAAMHLHAQGILHGDLYAHNILTDEAATPLLSDFGAAAFYDKQDTHQAALTERIEVRAFGYLLDDLLLRVSPEKSNDLLKVALSGLKAKCLQPDIMSRPDFAEICKELAGM